MVIGNGAREHAIAWKLKQSPQVDRLFVAPGNAGTEQIATNLPIALTDIHALAAAARSEKVDLTFVGPESPLAEGIVDLFQEQGLAIVGPTKAAAQIETSKVFAKDLMQKYSIPTGHTQIFSSYEEAHYYVETTSPPVVVKVDGLASGKGVTVCQGREQALEALHQCMVQRVFGAAGDRVLVEECLTGQELSVFAFTDGTHLSSLVAACDYKRVLDSDQGPNTGGMGSFSPPPFWTEDLSREVRETIMLPVVRAMASEGYPYRGILYGGLMITSEGPKVLEFNCRLGDPETQVILPRMRSDLLEVLLAIDNHALEDYPLEWEEKGCVGVVLASGGYPGEYRTDYPIHGLAHLDPEVQVFFAGVRAQRDESSGLTRVFTDGGRVMTMAALGNSLEEARIKAYEGVRQISFEGAHYRRDIAAGVAAPALRRE